jgi:hypothetical protein
MAYAAVGEFDGHILVFQAELISPDLQLAGFL